MKKRHYERMLILQYSRFNGLTNMDNNTKLYKLYTKLYITNIKQIQIKAVVKNLPAGKFDLRTSFFLVHHSSD